MQDGYCDNRPRNRSRSVHGEQKAERCPDPASELVGHAKTGQKCEAASDCAPTCCDCGNGRSWLAAACVNLRCTRGDIACLESEGAGSYCGRPCRGPGAPCWRGGECCSKTCREDHRCE
jgi:hypothetical protein